MRKGRIAKLDTADASPRAKDAVSAEPLRADIRIVRLPEITAEATRLLQEYYEEIGVLVRDTPADIQRIIEDPDGGVWLAYKGEEAVGCVYLHSLTSIPLATECKRLYVKPSARRQGVAQGLLDALEPYARSRGFKRIYLDSKSDLPVAIRLYASRGYLSCERYNDNPQATVFMVKDLAGRSSPMDRISHPNALKSRSRS